MALLAALVLPAAASAWTFARTSGPTMYIDTAATNGNLYGSYVSYNVTNDTGSAVEDVWVKADTFTGTGSVVSLADNEDGLIHVGRMAAGATQPVFFYLKATGATTNAQSHTVRVYDGKPGAGGTQAGSQTYSVTVVSQNFNNSNKVDSVAVSTTTPKLGGTVTVTVSGSTGVIGSGKILAFTPAAVANFPAKSLRLVSTQITMAKSPCGFCATFTNQLYISGSEVTATTDTPYTAVYTFLAANVTTTTTSMSPVGYISSGGAPAHTSTANFGSLDPIQPVTNSLTLATSANKALTNATSGSRTVTYTTTVTNSGSQQVTFDDIVDTLPTGATFVTGSVAWNGTTIADPQVSGGKATFVKAFTVPANGSRALTYQVRLASTDGAVANSVVAHSGATQIDTTLDTTDDAPASTSVTVDATAPTAAITLKPAAITSSRNATFGFDAGADTSATFECRLDGGSWSSCVSGDRWTSLSYTTHTFDVRATDAAGNVGTVASYTWEVQNIPDTTPPTVSFTSSPPAESADASPSIAFAADEDATFECKLDGGSWVACTSPDAIGPLSEGSHTFEVRPTDTANNVGTPISVTWTVDTTAPDVTITSAPSGTVATTGASIAFTSDDAGATLACRVDGGSWATCTSPLALTGLANGAHTVDVRATDDAGNVSTTRTASWTVDTVAPVITVTSAPAAQETSSTADVAFTVDDGAATTECKLDAGSWAACTSPVHLTGLAEGSHTLRIRATDTVGNESATSTITWSVDTVAPSVTVTSVPASRVTSTAVSVSFTVDDGAATAECKRDSGTWATCTSPYAATGLAEGSHTLLVRATDAAGNVSTTRTVTWTIDTTAPAVTLTSTPPTRSTTDTADVAFTVDDGGATAECKLDGGSWAACTSPVHLTGLAEGSHILRVRATDDVGNVSTVKSATWTVDILAPVVTITGGPSGRTATSSGSVPFTVDDPDATAECRLDSGSWATCTSPYAVSGLADGTHTVEVRATDQDNRQSAVRSRTWTVDTTAPTVTLADKPEDGTSTGARVTFTASEAGAAFSCRVDDGEWKTCASPLDLTGLTPGRHTVSVRATDGVGNTGVAVTHAWTVQEPAAGAPAPDSRAPKVTLAVRSSNEVVATGQRFDVSLVLGNIGTANATGVEASVQIPEGTEFVSAGLAGAPRTALRASGTVTCTPSGRTVACKVGDVAVGEHVEIQMTLRALRAGRFVVDASTTSDGQEQPATARATQKAAKCTIRGTKRPDVLIGTSGDDVICGLAGNDRLVGRGGNDVLLGGDGKDRLSGGSGNDRAYGGRGNDRIAGGKGRDTLSGWKGDDMLWGGAGNDRLSGGAGRDRLSGWRGRDRVYGGAGADVLQGGADNDLLSGGAGADRLDGGSGHNRTFGGAGDDLLWGVSGTRDLLDGGAGTDTVRGGPGVILRGFERRAA